MSGHSKWSTIKRQKGVTDAKRGAAFTKLGSQIAIAAREGGSGDIQTNFKLRLAVEKAKEANMPKENIQRSIDRGLGKGDAAVLESAVYEGYANHGVAVIVDAITDNKTRTGNEVRNLFNKSGGNLGNPGSVSYLFKRVGEIAIAKDGLTIDQVFDKALEAEAEDVQEDDESFLIITKPEDLHKVKERLSNFKITSAEIIYSPNPETEISLDDEKKQVVSNFLETLSDLDDVQGVYANLA